MADPIEDVTSPGSETTTEIDENINSQELEEGQDTTGKDEQNPPEETFAGSFDPAKLPPELQTVYKSMQADYTKKTQSIAGERAKLDEYTKLRPLIDRVLSDQDLLNMALGINPRSPQEEEIPDDPKAYAEWVQKKTLDKVQDIINGRERERMVEMARDNDYSSAEKVDPRLTEDENFARVIAGLVSQDQGFTSGNRSAVDSTREAIAFYDKHIAGIQSRAKQDLTDRARQKRSISTIPGSPGKVSSDSPGSIHEAYKQALEELDS